MRTRISSGSTWIMKFAFPLLWGGIWSFATTQLFLDSGSLRSSGGDAPPWWLKWVFLGGLLLGAALIGRIGNGLKRVELVDRTVRVSNYLREITIPIGQIEDVTLSTTMRVNNVPLARLELRHESDFGRYIEFIPASEAAYETLRAAVRPDVDSAHPRSTSV